MVITFDEDGTVQFTRKPEALALFPDQRFSIERMSDIVFDEDRQRYYIQWLKGPLAGERGELDFPSYEEAVACEIDIIDCWRLAGYTI
jgi:hypothetical protein